MGIVKVLPLESWQKDYSDFDQGVLPKHEHHLRLQEKQYPYMKKNCPRVSHCQWRDGRYFVRGKEPFCCFIRNGIMYKDDGDMFLYELKLLNADEKLGRVQLLEEFNDFHYKLFGKHHEETSEILRALANRMRYRESRRRIHRFKKKIEEMKSAK